MPEVSRQKTRTAAFCVRRVREGLVKSGALRWTLRIVRRSPRPWLLLNELALLRPLSMDRAHLPFDFEEDEKGGEGVEEG